MDDGGYPIKRDLDGVYFRINRNGKWENVCFSDLNAAEREEVTKDRPAEWLKQLAYIMADVLRGIGDFFDIVNEADREVDSNG